MVRNIIWTRHTHGDDFRQTTIKYGGAPGEYAKGGVEFAPWTKTTREYQPGTEYSMKANEVHSIFFARGTSVLFFEGPKVSDTSVILEPVVDGEPVPTFKVEPWAFNRGSA